VLYEYHPRYKCKKKGIVLHTIFRHSDEDNRITSLALVMQTSMSGYGYDENFSLPWQRETDLIHVNISAFQSFCSLFFLTEIDILVQKIAGSRRFNCTMDITLYTIF